MEIVNFSPLSGLLGGGLIGLSAVVLMATSGRIAGMSGLIAGLLLTSRDGQALWRLIFILGLMVGAAFAGLLFYDVNNIQFPATFTATVLGGLLVGFGTRLGAGCTSGHGVCGLARFSKRALIATVVFMSAAIITVYVTRHILG